jgi:hypothetical protein
MFLMRCLFTMFAENVGLLPENSFKDVLARCEQVPDTFPHDVGQLWEAMDGGTWAYALHQKVPRFNGEFFLNRAALPLAREEIGELRQAASHDWRDVDPSIFGTLLEQALDPEERRRLGAHYTPRAYVERLVAATVIEPLRTDWGNTVSTAERQKSEGRVKDALATVGGFHNKLCATRVLDPACGTGNFLYVALEMMKRLEGEVLEALADLGGQEALTGLEGHSVDPRQFLGLEENRRAVAIAELVLWIGHLQWQIRTKGGLPSEPILQAFKNVVVRDAVLAADKELARDATGRPVTRAGGPIEVYVYKSPRRPAWPEAEFIVGNPPFIGGKDIRARWGDAYAEALWAAHPGVNESADYVMYWWDRAADLLARKATALRRFGLVTTNSISQVFQRRVIERHLAAKSPISIVMAIPDHPWTKATKGAAAVRIAMTVCEAGARDGLLREVSRETGVDTDTPVIDFVEHFGRINADLTVGVDLSQTSPLLANEGLSSRGMSLHGSGFIVSPNEATVLGLGKREGLEKHIRAYRNGRDLTARPRNVMVIDLFGLDADDVRRRFPEVYQHLLQAVKPEREAVFEKSRTKDAAAYAAAWWLFGKPRQELRPALVGLPRYIVTVETMQHRAFQLVDQSVLPDNRLVVVASDDAYHLGVLQSSIHVVWTLANGGTLEDRPIYTKSRCFDPFPFPAANDPKKQRIRAIAEDLDAHRKRVLVEHPHLTLTGLYNVLERLRTAVCSDALDANEKRIFDVGLVLILQELHDKLDAAVADAYGWPVDLPDEDILARLVALNKERAKEEARGVVRWLRPEYQVSRYGSAKEKAELDLVGGEIGTGTPVTSGPRPAFPSDDFAQTAAIMSVLALAAAPLNAAAIAATFKQGRKVAPKVDAVLAALARTGYVTTKAGGAAFSMRSPL